MLILIDSKIFNKELTLYQCSLNVLLSFPGAIRLILLSFYTYNQACAVHIIYANNSDNSSPVITQYLKIQFSLGQIKPKNTSSLLQQELSSLKYISRIIFFITYRVK